MVYFIQSGKHGPIKIGMAHDPHRRLDSLQTGSPNALYLIGTIPGAASEERKLHSQFSELHIRGEWFKPGPELLSFIANHAELVRLTWAQLVEVEPRLQSLMDEAQRANQLYLDNANFCANNFWYRLDGGLRNRMRALVGYDAPGAPMFLRTTQAYDLAYKTLYESLPACRDCYCM